MKEPRFPDFPREAYLARYVRTQQSLKRHGLDALFLTQRQNLRYFAGLRDGAWDAYHFYFMVLLPVEGDPVLFVANGFNHLVKQCWIDDVRYWPWQKEFYLAKESAAIPLVIETLAEKSLTAGVIGIELSPEIHVHMGQQHFDALRRGPSQAKIVDGCDAIWEIRSIKSPAEIARLRQAANISAKGVRAGFEALKVGMTEKQVADIMTLAMWADGMPTDYVIQRGDLVQFDGGCVYEGYWCDFKRMACVGEPRPDQRRFYNLAKDGLFAAIKAVQPGVPFNAPLQAAFAVNDQAGFGAFSRWCLENG
jgi:Xaa-Pro dipeptidase